MSLDELQLRQKKTFAEFEKANQLLDNGRAEDAAKAYDQIILADPTTELDTMILFNAGVAYMAASDCDAAAERLRRTIRIADKKSPIIKYRALLKMSDVYTCLGEDNKAITNLIELYVGKTNLPVEIAKGEIPAKLAAAYARIGNKKEAEKYFRLAEKGLIHIQNQFRNSAERRDTLAKTLFLMGGITQINTGKMSADDYFITLRALQKYLFKSVEFDSRTWSPQAFAQIDRGYENTWDYINRTQADENPDAAINQRETTREKVRVAQAALQALNALYSERIPDPQEPKIVAELIQKMRTHEARLRTFIATNIVGTSLTPEALQAEGLRRQGQVLNPDPVLEKKSKQKKAGAKKP